jgi:hypothetical protein
MPFYKILFRFCKKKILLLRNNVLFFYEITFRFYELISGNYKIIFRKNELLFQNYELIFNKKELIFRNYELIFHNYELIFRKNELSPGQKSMENVILGAP